MSVRIQIHGRQVNVMPISRRPDGKWLVRTLEKTGRMVPGTRIVVSEGAVLEGTLPANGRGEPEEK